MKDLIYIFVGGGLGSVSRYLSQLLINERASGLAYPFSWGTFGVNVIGCLLIGLFYSLSERLNLSLEMRLFLTVGFCGGFTTFSTFSNDSLSLLKGGFYSTFCIYALLSFSLGLAGTFAGAYLGKHLF